jgi:hypothetical protein
MRDAHRPATADSTRNSASALRFYAGVFAVGSYF